MEPSFLGLVTDKEVAVGSLIVKRGKDGAATLVDGDVASKAWLVVVDAPPAEWICESRLRIGETKV